MKRLFLFFAIVALIAGLPAQDNDYRWSIYRSLIAKGNAYAFTLDQNLRTTDSPIFEGLTVKGRTVSNPATLVIAAANSKVLLADYYCDGTADEVQWQQANDALDGTNGGRMVGLEGTFVIDDPINFTYTGTPDNNRTIEGQGDSTVFKIPDSHTVSFNMFDAEGGTIASNMSSWTPVSGWTYGTDKWTHAFGGGVTPLADTYSTVPVVGQRYRVTVGYTHAGPGHTITIAIGGYTGNVINNAAYSSVTYEFVATTTDRMVITPTTNFTGSINSVEIIPVLYGLQFKNFKIDGNDANVTGDYIGIKLNGVSHSIIDNVTIGNGGGAYYGFFVQSCTDISVKNCNIGTWGNNGLEARYTDILSISNNVFNTSRLELYSSCSKIKITDNTVYETAFDLECTDGLVVSGNLFYNRIKSIGGGLSTNIAKNVIIADNYFNCMSTPLVCAANTNNIAISNNIILSNTTSLCGVAGTNGSMSGNKFIMGVNSGICLGFNTGAANWIVENNTFNIMTGTTGTKGIVVTQGTDISIRDNDFHDIATGISIAATATSVKAFDNDFDGCTTDYTNAATLSANFEYGKSNRRVYKITTPFGNYSAEALAGDKVLVVLPAKTKIVGMYCDTTTKYTGGAVSAATLIIGKSAGGGEYIASHDVFTAAVVKGQADADMGTELTRAAAIQGGALVDWTTAITVYARLTTVGANTSALTQGSTTFYIETESY